ncbi:DNA-binding LytR/AlgR family response regulator [Mesonia hippocampi]|uniref:DNA-binding LytR/AlgR family response regulator n=1 Tax=Mesonia hippocampi TaxID=1628250 RepID=A0A840EQ99_9FLAO|nr:LytTR family DNA-binding domain-containing protein [Mesonia hippocampi]MBB4119231.1 DNA-binding LytR/AlgR family response regulator [Mesonia hippocampi]
MKTSKINCIVVDDSDLQRLVFIKLINKHPRLNLVGVYKNAIKAKNTLLSDGNNVDLIFLDIDLPLLSGFDLLDNLEKPKKVIFISEHDKHALKAFNYGAIDYLKKLVTKNRFEQAVERALNHFSSTKNLLNKAYIFVKSKNQKYKIFINEINYLIAKGDYVSIVTESAEYAILSTLKACLEKLPKGQFMRVHKSYAVNLYKIQRYTSQHVFINNTKIPLSRNRKKTLETTLQNLSYKN